MEKIFEKSENIRMEYCCSIVRIGEVKPIEGSDFLGQTLVNGLTIVVRKDEIAEGDVCIYAMNETALNKDFLSANDIFSDPELNRNYGEYKRLVAAGDAEGAKKYVGFFNKHGRVKMIKLRGVPSQGILFKEESLRNWKNLDYDLESHVGEDFDTIGGELFVNVYMPPMPAQQKRLSRGEHRQKKVDRFDTIIPGTFFFHYDTEQLAKNIDGIKPDDVISITLKVNGTSAIFANILVRKPLKINIFKKLWYIVTGKRTYEIVHDLVYSSRNVIKNQFINPDHGDFYEIDIWNYWAEIVKPFIPEGTTVYGEIVGYLPDSPIMIQKDYDYGCAVGTSKFMPYRVSIASDGAPTRELNIPDVISWAKDLAAKIEAAGGDADSIMPLTLFYHGAAKDLYGDLDVRCHWQENVLERMKNDFGLEKREPLCKAYKVPREGICLRIDDDPMKECFKLKANAYLLKESALIDEGVVDIEMQQSYGQGGE